MTILEEEFRVIKRVHEEMFKAVDRDNINKIYRQARVWNRFHHFLAAACSYEKYRFFNNKFKKFRYAAIDALR